MAPCTRYPFHWSSYEAKIYGKCLSFFLLKYIKNCFKPYKIAWDFDFKYGGLYSLLPDIDNTYYWLNHQLEKTNCPSAVDIRLCEIQLENKGCLSFLECSCSPHQRYILGLLEQWRDRPCLILVVTVNWIHFLLGYNDLEFF